MTEETPGTSTDPALGAEGDADQLTREDQLLDRGVGDLLDEGYSPPERDRPTHYGETPWEERHRETIDQRMAQEEPEIWDDDRPAGGDREEFRAGRLEGVDGTDAFADDVGVAGGAASAEESAMHVVPDPSLDEPLYRADDQR
jgi:hypothetical protein